MTISDKNTIETRIEMRLSTDRCVSSEIIDSTTFAYI